MTEQNANQIIDTEFLKSLKPCINRWKNWLENYSEWSGSLVEFLDLDKITHKDKLWVVLRKEIIPERELHLLACDFAESVLHIFEKKYPNDKRLRRAIEVKKLWIDGEATNQERQEARIAAHAAAAYAAAHAAAAYAAAHAAYDAAHAAYAAAHAAAAAVRKNEKKRQIEMIKKVLVRL